MTLPGTEIQWLASVLPLLILVPILVMGLTGEWKPLKWFVAALIVTAIGGAWLIDWAAGNRSLAGAVLSTINRATLLFAAFSLSSALYFPDNRALTLTPWRLTVLVASSFVIGLAVDPLLALVLVVYPMLRRQAPLQSVVVATVASGLSGVFSWHDPGLFGHWVTATLELPDRWLWSQGQAYAAVIFTLLCLLVLHWAYVRYYTNAPRRVNTRLWTTLQAPDRRDWMTFGGLLTALVAVQYLLPDVHDQVGKAVLYSFQGKQYLIREELYEFIPWREVAQLLIGMAALWRRESQQKNKMASKPIFKAIQVLCLLYLAVTPLMTAAYENRDEWPTMVSLLYDLLGWIRVHWDPLWVKVMALSVAYLLLVLPQFAVLAMIAHHGGVSGAKAKGEKGKLTLGRHLWWALWLGVLPFTVAIIIVSFSPLG